MTKEFACEFYYTKCEGENNYEDWTLVSSIITLSDYIDFYSDIFQLFVDDKKSQELEDGDYHIFVCGEVEYQSDMDWESGMEEGNFEFGWDNEDMTIVKMPDENAKPIGLSV